MNLDEKEGQIICLLYIVIETDDFGMENIFEQMRRYKGKVNRKTFFQKGSKRSIVCLEEADRLTGDDRKQFAEKVVNDQTIQ